MVVVVAAVYPRRLGLYRGRLLLEDRAVVLHQMRWPAREEELLGKDTREQVV
jgi:hypothetical protein